MLEFAGVPLTVVTPEMAEAVEARLSVQDIYPWDTEPAFVGRGGYGLAAQRWYNRPPRIGRLFWPTGCSRWATAFYLATGDQLDEIQSTLKVGEPGELDLGDGDNGVSCFMYLLSPRQLLGIPYVDGLWLLPLVDARYFYWGIKSGNFQVASDTLSWSEVLATLGKLLGLNLGIDAIAEVYGLAPASLTAIDEPIPPLLDYVAGAVGHRVVFALNGAATTMTWESAKKIQAANLKTGNPLIGGPGIHPLDIAPLIPSDFRIDFPQLSLSSGATTGQVSPVNLLTADLPLGFDTGSNGTGKVLFHPLEADIDGEGHWLNEEQCIGAAVEYATDWIGWQTGPLDARWFGIVEWEPEALEDYVEWTYLREDCSTRVERYHFIDGDSPPTAQWHYQLAVRDKDNDDPTQPTDNIVYPAYTIIANNLVYKGKEIGNGEGGEDGTYSIDYPNGRIQMTPVEETGTAILDWQGLKVHHKAIEKPPETGDALLQGLGEPSNLSLLQGLSPAGEGGQSTLSTFRTYLDGIGWNKTVQKTEGRGFPDLTDLLRNLSPETVQGQTPETWNQTLEALGYSGLVNKIFQIPPGGGQLQTQPAGGGLSGTGQLFTQPVGQGQLQTNQAGSGTDSFSEGQLGGSPTTGGGLFTTSPSGFGNLFPSLPPQYQEEDYGPEPDIEFVDTEDLTWQIEDKQDQRRIVITPKLNLPPGFPSTPSIIEFNPTVFPPILLPQSPIPIPPLPPSSGSSPLATFNAYAPQNLSFPTFAIIANNDLGAVAFGRIFFAAKATGMPILCWQGFRVAAMSPGDTYPQWLGPVPDIAFIDGQDISFGVSVGISSIDGLPYGRVGARTNGITAYITVLNCAQFNAQTCQLSGSIQILGFRDGLLVSASKPYYTQSLSCNVFGGTVQIPGLPPPPPLSQLQ